MAKTAALVMGLCLCFLFTGTVFGETRTYKKTVGEEEFLVTCDIKDRADGYRIHIAETRDGQTVITEELDVDRGFSTRSWSIVDRDKGIEVAAEREGKILHITKTENGRVTRKDSRIDEDPWYQLFALSFEKFAASDREKVTFWSVNPDEARPYEFSLTKQEVQRIPASGSSMTCTHIRIALTGFLAAFWHADCWHRRGDGLFARYEGINGRPGAPLTVVQLLQTGE